MQPFTIHNYYYTYLHQILSKPVLDFTFPNTELTWSSTCKVYIAMVKTQYHEVKFEKTIFRISATPVIGDAEFLQPKSLRMQNFCNPGHCGMQNFCNPGHWGLHGHGTSGDRKDDRNHFAVPQGYGRKKFCTTPYINNINEHASLSY